MKFFRLPHNMFRFFTRTAVFVAFLSCIPVWLFLAHLEVKDYFNSSRRIISQAEAVVKSVDSIQRGITEEAQVLLAPLAHAASFTTRQGNVLAGFFARLSPVHAGYNAFFLVNAKGVVIAAKSVGGDPLVQVNDRLRYVENRDNAPFFVGEVAFSRNAEKAVLHYGYAVEDADGRKLLLGVGVDDGIYSKAFELLDLPTGSRLYLADRRGKIAFAKPALRQNLLPALPEQIYREVLKQPSDQGAFSLAAKDGETRVIYQRIALAPGDEPYMLAVLTLPGTALKACAQDAQQRSSISFLLVFFAMAGIILLLAKVLVSPVVPQVLDGIQKVVSGKETSWDPVHLPCEFQALATAYLELTTTKSLKDSAVDNAREQVEAAAKAKSQFLANMSHEIRTPMNAIIGMAYLTLQEPLAIYQKEYLNNIHTSGQQLLQVVNDILELSSLDTGQSTAEEDVSFSLRDVLVEIRHRFSSFASEQGISIILSIAPNVPQNVGGNPHRLSQVIGHLVDNAIRYSSRGVVEISCANEATTESSIILSIAVKDHGRGLSPDQRIAIQRMLDERNPNFCENVYGDSQSLGLLLAQRMLLLLGGRLSVVSEVDMGSVFTVHVPLRICPLDVGARYLDSLRDMRVLAVDDDDISLGIIAALLREFGMRVDITMAPADAVQYVEHADKVKDPYRFIILDWKMPTHDGLELCTEIKHRLTLASHPSIIVMSAFGTGLPELAKQQAGVDAFLHKPINQSVLFDTIINLLQMQSNQTSLVQQYNLDDITREFDGLSVLLAEDNPINQQIALELLDGLGMNITLVSDGEEALRVFSALPEEAPFDIVLTDLQMPRLNGYELSRRIRRLPVPWATDIPVIAMTAHSRNSELGDFTASGLSDYVGKPIAVEDLFKAISRWLPVSAIFDRTVCSVVCDLYELCEKKQLLPALSLLKEVAGLLEPSFREGRVRRLRELILAGRFDLATAFLDRLNQKAQFMQRGKK